jgi:hypothetical protein
MAGSIFSWILGANTQLHSRKDGRDSCRTLAEISEGVRLEKVLTLIGKK